MALSPAEQTQIKALIVREGGPAAFTDTVQDLYIASAQATAITSLTSTITVTVKDWNALDANAAAASNATLYSTLSAIETAAEAKDSSQLGPLLWALYGAAKAHFGV